MNIYKYPLTSMFNRIEMPEGAKILTMQLQNGTPCIWALVEPNAPKTERIFEVLVTGIGFKDSPATYIGTYQFGGFVGHVFEITNK